MSDDALWYKDAVIYQLRVRSFYDSDDDGIGDLRGLTEKLDYLQDLGVTALWLLPFYPSPLRDDGYDIADYGAVDPQCGTLRDFRAFLRAAHRRDLRVITELVINHTSDQHPWFQRARHAPPGSRWRDFYVWSDAPDRYREARIIFKDFEHSNWAWDPVAKAYYWHRFYSHQPDLNFDNAEVRRAVFQVLDFWLDMGVDGLRLDAVPYLFEREGTSCENLPETHAFLSELRAHVDRHHANRMLLAEANQWPEDAAAYFGKGDECHMAFHFPIMPRLFMAIHMEDRYPILDILEQTPAIPDTAQWAIFLRNHDELTLEMVTDEERDYMWRVYARDPRARINLGIRRRLAPLLENNRRRIELMKALLLSLPGTPVIYYGDEIGMGDNVYLGDRNGVRTPMQWSPDRNAGFSRANPQRLVLPLIMDPEYHFEAVNVEVQQANPSSLLWWTKRVLALRKQFRALGSGRFEALNPENRKVLAFLRRHGEEVVLVVANLSRFPQYVELDLREFKGLAPVELFGHAEFPSIGELPYLLTLGPHAFYWFALEAPRGRGAGEPAATGRELPVLEAGERWATLFQESRHSALERILPDWLPAQRWFRSKARQVRNVRLLDVVPVDEWEAGCLAFAGVEYAEGEPETYVLPLAWRPGPEPAERALARVRLRGGAEGSLVEASGEPGFAAALLDLAARRRRTRGRQAEIRGQPAGLLRRLGRGDELSSLPARLLGAEQSNTSWIFGDRLVGKLLRRLDEGINPELEITARLTEAEFPHVPALAGHLEVRLDRERTATLALFQAYVPNEGDAWRFTLDEIERCFETVITRHREAPGPTPPRDLLERAGATPDPSQVAPFAAYLDLAELLGRRTAELHRTLASCPDDAAFSPEQFTPFSRRSFYQSLRNLGMRVLDILRDQLADLPEGVRPLAERVLAAEDEIFGRFHRVTDRPLGGRLIRCHGDYHLGQVLWTGRDFVVIDFEGEPARSLGERRRKRSPLTDVAGMLRSFDYAAESALAAGTRHAHRPEDRPVLQPWARLWAQWVSARFLATYLEDVRPAQILPEDGAELGLLLDVHLLEKALYEVGYELNNRPTWVAIPLRGIHDVLGLP